jgi:predicted alpha-1,2-mannosidase
MAAAKIYGFSQTTINGCRFNYVPLMPTTGPVTSTNPADYASSFTRASEVAQPDKYHVMLDDYGVGVDLTATTRTGWQRYTFPKTTQANVLFNTGAGVSSSEIQIVGDRTVEGWVVADSRKTYFVTELSRPFSASGTWKGSTLSPGSTESTASGSNGGWVSFDTTTDDSPVVAKVGLSFTGLDGAKNNLAAETDALGFDYDAAQQALHTQWNTLLGKASVAGGTHDQQVAYYTALYHSLLDPNVVDDVDGRYLGYDGTLRTATNFTPYSNFSLWDTYRTQNQLIELLAPQVARDIDLSVLAVGQQQGALPRWFLGIRENNIMTGDPVTPFLVEGWSKGLFTQAEAQEAYKYIKANATKVPPADVPMNGRAAADYYNRLGYIPYGLHVSSTTSCTSEDAGQACCPTKGNDNDCYYPASSALEYAAADASLSLMAKGLGHTQDAAMFAQRGETYHNIYDRSVGLFRPRNMDGTWLSPYDTSTGDHTFHEGTPIQYQWLVPQDPQGLVSMLGGRTATTKKLDTFFAYPQLLQDPSGTAHNTWVSDPMEYYGPTTYAPDNEPDVLAPYLYAWTGRPDKTATVVHAAETLYSNTPGGITGNDDMGEMSAWYVMSALGIYPTMAGGNFYVVTSPLFPQATVQIGAWKTTQGGTLTISAPGTSMSNRYIASAKVNGRAWPKAWVSQSDIAHGATIDYKLSTSPSRWATSPAAAPPSVDTVPVTTHQLSAQLTPTQAVVSPTKAKNSRQRVTLTLLATSPGKTNVSVSGKAPAGWLVSPVATTVPVASKGLPTQVTVPVTITAPRGTKAGSYKVTVTATMTGAAKVTSTTTVVVGKTEGCVIQTSTSCAVDLSSAYDNDGVATVAAPAEGNFDGLGYSYDAAQLPAAGPTTLAGVTYQAPSTAGTDPNFVQAKGQAVTLPGGKFSSLDVVGAASNGDTGTSGRTAVITYTDGSTDTVDLHFTDWGSRTPADGNTVAATMASRLSANGPNSVAVSLFHATIPLNDRKSVRAITLPRPAVPIWVAPGLGGVAWDHDSTLQIYAMTLQH